MPDRVLLAYRYPVVLHALRGLVERHGLAVAGEISNLRDAVPLARQLQPDVAILDFELPYANGLDCAKQMIEENSNIKCILLARHREAFHVREAVRIGIKGYVLKTEQPEELERTILEVSCGGTRFSPEVSGIARKYSCSRRHTVREPIFAAASHGNFVIIPGSELLIYQN